MSIYSMVLGTHFNQTTSNSAASLFADLSEKNNFILYFSKHHFANTLFFSSAKTQQ